MKLIQGQEDTGDLNRETDVLGLKLHDTGGGRLDLPSSDSKHFNYKF